MTTYQQHIEDPLPVQRQGKRGQASEYDPAALLAWSTRQELKKLRIDEDGKVYDYDVERARLTHNQANKTALEEDTLKGALIPADMVKETWATLVMSFRAKMLALPSKAAGEVAQLDAAEAHELLTNHVYEALTELDATEPPLITQA